MSLPLHLMRHAEQVAFVRLPAGEHQQEEDRFEAGGAGTQDT
jgi:hypothetical protein